MLFKEISEAGKNKKEVKKFRFGFSDSFIVTSLIHHYLPDILLKKEKAVNVEILGFFAFKIESFTFGTCMCSMIQ